MQSIANDLIETWKLKDFTGGRPSHRNVDPQRWTFEYFFVGFHLGQSLATPKPVNGSDMFPWKRCTENMFESRWCQRFSPKKAGATHHYHDDIWSLITYIFNYYILSYIPKEGYNFWHFQGHPLLKDSDLMPLLLVIETLRHSEEARLCHSQNGFVSCGG